MSKLLIALFIAAGLGVAGAASAQTYPIKTASTATMSKSTYTAAKQDADAQYKVDKDACSSLSGNAKDICIAEAKGKDNIAKADAEAAFTNTPKMRQSARLAHAQANYDVAIEKCDDLAGNPKDVCVKEAKSAVRQGQGGKPRSTVSQPIRARTRRRSRLTPARKRPPTSATPNTGSRSRSATRWQAP